MGAWIETDTPWIKHYKLLVAPYVGAWIETRQVSVSLLSLEVAPYVGAWIETSSSLVMHPGSSTSHPMWVRGLKHSRFR